MIDFSISYCPREKLNFTADFVLFSILVFSSLPTEEAENAKICASTYLNLLVTPIYLDDYQILHPFQRFLDRYLFIDFIKSIESN